MGRRSFSHARPPQFAAIADSAWLKAGLSSLILPGANGRVFDLVRRGTEATYSAITANDIRSGLATSNTSTGTGNISMPGICQGQKFSRLAIVRVNGLSGANVISDSRSSSSVGGAQWRILSSGEMDLVKGQTVQLAASTGAGMSPGAEATVGITYDGTAVKFFKNGVLLSSGNSTQTFNIDASGRLFASGGAGEWLNGQIALHADFIGALDDATMRALTGAPWRLLASMRRGTATAAPSAPTLAIADAIHGHAADAPSLTQEHALAMADATHAHQADGLALGQVHQLATADAQHAQAAEAIAIAQTHQVAIADAMHAHAADALDLSQVHALAVQGTSHGHSSDALTLTQLHLLAVANALHAHAAEHIDLSAAITLAIADAMHAHETDAFAFSQAHALSVADALHAHSAEGLTLGAGVSLVIADALHTHAADAVALGQVHVMVVSDAIHAQLVDAMALALPGAVLAPDRCLLIPAEGRVLVVVAESRALQIAAESRVLTVH